MGRSRTDLPISLVPRGLSRVLASLYVGVSTTKFDQLVREGRMPSPKRIDARNVWDRLELDVAFAALPDTQASSEINPWDLP